MRLTAAITREGEWYVARCLEVVAALGRLGLARVSQRGSHVKLKNEAGRVVIVPMHRELAAGMVRRGSIAATKA